MASPDTVVPKPQALTEDQFHARFLQALSRLISNHGDGQVALWLGVTRRQLANIKGGSLPTADKIWNLLVHDDSAHDEIDRSYGHRKVPENAICSTDTIAARMASLLTRAIEAEHPDSPGGPEVILQEILGMDEPVMRDVHRRLGNWLARIEDYRAPTMRSVA